MVGALVTGPDLEGDSGKIADLDLDRDGGPGPSRLFTLTEVMSASGAFPPSVRARLMERFSGEPHAAGETCNVWESAKTSKVVWK